MKLNIFKDFDVEVLTDENATSVRGGESDDCCGTQSEYIGTVEGDIWDLWQDTTVLISDWNDEGCC